MFQIQKYCYIYKHVFDRNYCYTYKNVSGKNHCYTNINKHVSVPFYRKTIVSHINTFHFQVQMLTEFRTQP